MRWYTLVAWFEWEESRNEESQGQMAGRRQGKALKGKGKEWAKLLSAHVLRANVAHVAHVNSTVVS